MGRIMCEKHPERTVQEVLDSFGTDECIRGCSHFQADDYGAFYCDYNSNSFTEFMGNAVSLKNKSKECD